VTTRSGFISVVGRPNVGKSTLVNSLVGQKVAITSSRPQTTRNTIRGVLTLTDPDRQLVLVDTPGLHRPRTALGERLNKLVYGSLAEADAAVFVLDALQEIGPGDRLIAARLAESKLATVVVVNKVDAASKLQVADSLAEAGLWDFAAYVPLSALQANGLPALIGELSERLPEGPMYFPAEAHSDQPDRLFAAELIREKYLARLAQELPHSVAVVIGDIETRDNGVVHVPATVFVERDSQKGIVIGKGGAMIRDVGAEARRDLEVLFGAKCFVDLRVRVEKDWQRRDEALDRMGF
jgi:GTP-binding protein Era